jgi:hypothetical protein
MAGQDKRAQLKGELAEGVLRIPEREGEWHQALMRTFWVEVSDLTLYQTVSVDEGATTRMARLVGNGEIKKDRLRLAGWGDGCRTLPVTVKPALPQEDGNGYEPFSAVLGFIPGQEDFRSEDAWFLEAWLPPEDIDNMVAAYRAGEMPAFSLGARLDLWIARGDEYTPPGYGITWYLVPPARRASEFPEAARGKVHLVSWGNARSDDKEVGPPELVSVPTASPATVAAPATGPDTAALAVAVDRLRGTVLRVGVAIAAAVAIGWFL